MFISHVYFYLFQIIFTFQCSFSAVLNIITQDSERLLFTKLKLSQRLHLLTLQTRNMSRSKELGQFRFSQFIKAIRLMLYTLSNTFLYASHRLPYMNYAAKKYP